MSRHWNWDNSGQDLQWLTLRRLGITYKEYSISRVPGLFGPELPYRYAPIASDCGATNSSEDHGAIMDAWDAPSHHGHPWPELLAIAGWPTDFETLMLPGCHPMRCVSAVSLTGESGEVDAYIHGNPYREALPKNVRTPVPVTLGWSSSVVSLHLPLLILASHCPEKHGNS